MSKTWLNERIWKEAEWEQYKTFWADRVKVKQGGVAVYVQSEFEGKQLIKISHKKCTLMTVSILAINTVNIVTYKPPKIKLEKCYEILSRVEIELKILITLKL